MRIALDIETDLSHKKVWTVKTLNIDTEEIRTWKEANSLEAFLKDASWIIGHNVGPFDLRVLKRQWSLKIETTTKVFDTLTVSRLLDPSRENGHSLESWGRTLGTNKVPYERIWEWIEDRRQEYPGECFDRPHMPLLEYYCEGDVRLTRLLFLHLEKEVKRLGFSEKSVELEHQVSQICTDMEEAGFRLDVVHATCLITDWKGKLESIKDRAQELYPPVVVERYSEKTGKRLKDGVCTFNIGSRQQIADKLKQLGWRAEKHTEKGSVVVDEAVLEDILRECG
jgi:DNA polymerase-1